MNSKQAIGASTNLLSMALLVMLACSPLQAAPVASHVRGEIDALLSTMQASRCEFSRNGSWYAAPDAKAHLLMKLDYLEGKNAVQTTEQFIELAASSSSSSGQPYLVKCANAAPMESRQWLLLQLKAVRSPGRAAASAPK
jgi:hypothetical protein